MKHLIFIHLLSDKDVCPVHVQMRLVYNPISNVRYTCTSERINLAII